MLISYKWLQEYIDDELPGVEELSDILTFHCFEIEEVTQVGDDTVFDIDVLPNRAHDCLSHFGIAKEICVATGLTHKPLFTEDCSVSGEQLTVVIDDAELCRRYSGYTISGIKVEESPDWLREALEAVGQRSINTLVDVTNYAMFALGQPMHAYDFEKLSGESKSIKVRRANPDEVFVSLDDQEYILTNDHLVIADVQADGAVIGLAGVKGGNSTGVSETTTKIILEAANFHPTNIRKTARGFNLLTDASKRFENERSPEFTKQSLDFVVGLFRRLGYDAVVESAVDEYPTKLPGHSIEISAGTINKVIGSDYSKDEVETILDRFAFDYETNEVGNWVVAVPPERLDLKATEDMVEEIARIMGLRNLKSTPLPEFIPIVSKDFDTLTQLKDILVELGLHEVSTYSLVKKGDMQIANPLASDKGALRKNIFKQLDEALTLNAHNAPLLGTERIGLFEIGRVFTKTGERIHLCVGIFDTKKQVLKLSEYWQDIETSLQNIGLDVESAMESVKNHDKAMWEIDLSDFLENKDTPDIKDAVYLKQQPTNAIDYKPVSAYPYMLRDIALWAPSTTTSKDIEVLIKKEAGDLLVHLDLFDVYEKDGQTSHAFHLVFQSAEKTLTDDEIGVIMQGISELLLAQDGFEIR